jgi:phage-related protein
VDGACYDSITFDLYCQPFRYSEPDAAPVIVTETPGQIENPGTQYSEPVVTIRGSGDISVLLGQYQMDFEGLTDGIIVDCALEECFSLDRSELMNRYASMDEFPRLMPGVNFVQWTGTVESIHVERRCRDVRLRCIPAGQRISPRWACARSDRLHGRLKNERAERISLK